VSCLTISQKPQPACQFHVYYIHVCIVGTESTTVQIHVFTTDLEEWFTQADHNLLTASWKYYTR